MNHYTEDKHQGVYSKGAQNPMRGVQVIQRPRYTAYVPVGHTEQVTHYR
jgi:hypothetical protein